MTQGVARPGAAEVYSNVGSCVAQVWREEGVRGLTRGLGARLLFAAAFNSIGLPLFEAGKARVGSAVLARRRRRLGARGGASRRAAVA